MRRSIPLVFAALLLAAGGVWLVWRPPTEAPGIIEVSGRVEGDQAAVGAKVGGRIIELPVREGAKLEAGDLIAGLASEQVRAQLARAEHVEHGAREQLAQATARVATAERQLEAARTAVQLGERVSRARIGEAEAAVGSARARLEQAEADLERAERDYGRARELFTRELIAASEMDRARAGDGVAR
jgi:HlyD family secretion protein